MLSDTGEHPFVRNGHLIIPKEQATHGEIKKWECKGCGLVSTRKEPEPCDEPALWLQLDAPGDGLGVCEECDAVFAFTYETPFYAHTCPECDSLAWYRDDDPDANADEVLLP